MGKELTPIQQAIAHIKYKIHYSHLDELEEDALRATVFYLQSLLPSERTFAHECFVAGVDYKETENAPFRKFYSKYETE